jgi:CspA family cold shock protein
MRAERVLLFVRRSSDASKRFEDREARVPLTAAHGRAVMLNESVVQSGNDVMSGDAVLSGTVKWFNNAKGWGFIRQDTGPDVFVHYSQIAGDGFRTLREGDVVRFELRDGPKGPLAERVSRVD